MRCHCYLMVVVGTPVPSDSAHYAAAAAVDSHAEHTADWVSYTLVALALTPVPVLVLAVRRILSCLNRADCCDFGCD